MKVDDFATLWLRSLTQANPGRRAKVRRLPRAILPASRCGFVESLTHRLFYATSKKEPITLSS
jgi:hypothetical protein